MAPFFRETIDQTSSDERAKKHLCNFGHKLETDIMIASRGLYVWTASGHRFLDWTSGQMSCLIGHGHPETAQTVADHARDLDHLFRA